MSEMIERVSRAIYVERATQAGLTRSLEDFDNDTSPMPTASRALAIAAIKAMREPTKEMVQKAEATSSLNLMGCPTIGWKCAIKLWAASIEEALK